MAPTALCAAESPSSLRESTCKPGETGRVAQHVGATRPANCSSSDARACSTSWSRSRTRWCRRTAPPRPIRRISAATPRASVRVDQPQNARPRISARRSKRRRPARSRGKARHQEVAQTSGRAACLTDVVSCASRSKRPRRWRAGQVARTASRHTRERGAQVAAARFLIPDVASSARRRWPDAAARASPPASPSRAPTRRAPRTRAIGAACCALDPEGREP